jgi:hypothetical protein
MKKRDHMGNLGRFKKIIKLAVKEKEVGCRFDSSGSR